MKFPITEGQLTSLHSHVLSLSRWLIFINMGTKARHQLDWDTYKPFLQCTFTFSKFFTYLSKRFSNDGITCFDPTEMWCRCMKTVKPYSINVSFETGKDFQSLQSAAANESSHSVNFKKHLEICIWHYFEIVPAAYWNGSSIQRCLSVTKSCVSIVLNARTQL